MPSREEFLHGLWNNVINAPLSQAWIDHSIAESERCPDAPFSDVGKVLRRLLALGASRTDLCILSRSAAYEAVFDTLYRLSDPDVDNNDVFMLHESLLGADPSGKEGRPGSAPTDASH